jgi:hypothetical protein
MVKKRREELLVKERAGGAPCWRKTVENKRAGGNPKK